MDNSGLRTDFVSKYSLGEIAQMLSKDKFDIIEELLDVLEPDSRPPMAHNLSEYYRKKGSLKEMLQWGIEKEVTKTSI